MGGLGQLQHSEASPVPSFFTFTENTFVWILLAILAGHVKGWDDRSCFAAPSSSLIGTWSCLVLWNVMQWVAIQSNPGEPFLFSCPHDSNYWRMTQKCMLSSCRLACKHLKHEWDKYPSRQEAEKEHAILITFGPGTRVPCLLITLLYWFLTWGVTIQFTKKCFLFFSLL